MCPFTRLFSLKKKKKLLWQQPPINRALTALLINVDCSTSRSLCHRRHISISVGKKIAKWSEETIFKSTRVAFGWDTSHGVQPCKVLLGDNGRKWGSGQQGWEREHSGSRESSAAELHSGTWSSLRLKAAAVGLPLVGTGREAGCSSRPCAQHLCSPGDNRT